MQEFIDLGWHTVPLSGELRRLPSGKKTIPEFRKGWRQRYQEEFNKEVTPLGGAITGKVSNIIAIDCDNENTFKIFKSLDPNYEFIFESKGKGYKAGTIIYEYTPELDENFLIKTDDIELDFYSNYGFIYLPSEANETKFPFTMCSIKPAPAATVALLKQLRPTEIVNQERSRNVTTANCLRPLVEKFVSSGEFMQGLFRIITPRSFRQERQYIEQGYLHPENVPSGAGSEYLSKVSAILGKDPSIDDSLYIDAMTMINEMWPEPMDQDRLEKTILDPMITGGASINGEPIWFFDENWQDYNLAIHTKRDNLLYLGYDDTRHTYYSVDPERETVDSYEMDNELMRHISTVAVAAPKKAELIRSMPLINVVNSPLKDFGFIEGETDKSVKTLNVFKRTPAMNVLLDPKAYEAHYQEPITTINYFKALVPNEEAREWLLRFLLRKLTKFEYSPIVLYFIGVHGSGKDTLVNLLERIMGKVNRPTVKEFLDKYNSYMLDAHFVQLDEYGDQLTTYKEKDEARGKIKAYSGKARIDIRQMRTDSYSYDHSVTFIMTANRQPLTLEDGDRRVAFFNTPNKMVDKFRDVPSVLEKIESETLDFCYYLATEFTPLTKAEFTTPLESEERHMLIADSMPAGARLTYAIKHNMSEYLIDLASLYGVDLEEDLLLGRVSLEKLEDLYMELTEQKGDMRGLTKQMRASNLNPHRSGNTAYYRLNFGS